MSIARFLINSPNDSVFWGSFGGCGFFTVKWLFSYPVITSDGLVIL